MTIFVMSCSLNIFVFILYILILVKSSAVFEESATNLLTKKLEIGIIAERFKKDSDNTFHSIPLIKLKGYDNYDNYSKTDNTKTKIKGSPISRHVKRQTDSGFVLEPNHDLDEANLDLNDKYLTMYIYFRFDSSYVCDAVVTAKLTTVNGVNYEITLLDNGEGVDNRKNDGYYTGIWEYCKIKGRYNIDYHANITSKTGIVKRDASNKRLICDPLNLTTTRLVHGTSILVSACKFKPLAGEFINNLQCVIDESTKMVVITWVDTWEEDSVVKFSLRYLPEITDSRNNSVWDLSKVIAEVPVGKINGSRTLSFDLSKINAKKFTVALRAEDGTGRAEVSLPFAVYVPQSLWPTTTISTSTSSSSLSTTVSSSSFSTTTSSSSSTRKSSTIYETAETTTFQSKPTTSTDDSTSENEESSLKKYIGLGLGLGFLVIGVITGFSLLWKRCYQQKSEVDVHFKQRDESDVQFGRQDESVVQFGRQDESVVQFGRQDESVVQFGRQDESVTYGFKKEYFSTSSRYEF